jgi:hypothetical protein
VVVANRKIALANPFLDQKMREAALNAVESDRYTKGENIKFEEELTRYVSVRYPESMGTMLLTLWLRPESVEAE